MLTSFLLLFTPPSWAGTRTSPSGFSIKDDLVSTGGALLTQGAFTLNGGSGQIVVGQSMNGSGNVVFHGVFGPLAGEGGGEGEGQAEGQPEGQPEGQAEGQIEGEGQAEGQIEGEGEGDGEGTVEGEGQAEGQPEGQAEGQFEGEGQIEGEGEPQGLTITILGDNPVTVQKSASHTFTTLVSGQTGSVSYKWYFEASSKVFVPLPNGEDPSYTVQDAQNENAGFYVCEASDNLDTVLSNTVELIVAAGVPAANGLGLVALILGTSLASVVVVHRKKSR